MSIWLAGNRITAAKLNLDSVELEDATTSTTTSTSFGNLASGVFSASITVPASGIVKSNLRTTSRNSTTNNSITSIQAVGSVSGTVISPSSSAATIVGGTSNLSLEQTLRIEGLVPGEILTVTSQHRVNAASTMTVDYRYLLLEGIQ